ncbi:hypothetical protein [Oceanispirochaeta sp.]|jgi:hypothetical protein|uniref:hypothetical protein n=1 Tax=Oceanispirochaeta sp. TaxID=2035350 RepID=UPI00261BD3E6|nr:hypothetical protein [Oceanispirochaeta sp.]MDA3957427.1 hypothetical protein [Oceanispirochaeta sp.]
MEKRFEQVDKRIEQVAQRFEEMSTDMKKSFSLMFWFGTIGFVALGTLMSVYQFLS